MIDNNIQKVLLELKRQKKSERFPDHIYAQANRVMYSAGSICENAHLIKYEGELWEDNLPFIKQSLISTMASCLRMLEELEK